MMVERGSSPFLSPKKTTKVVRRNSLKKTIFASLLLVVVVLLTACNGSQPVEPTVEPTATEVVVPTVEPTVEPTAVPTEEPTEVPTATPYPSDWREAVMIRDSQEYECSGDYNDAGNCIFTTIRPERDHVIYEDETFICAWPVQADGGKVCLIKTGPHAGTYANVRHLEWTGESIN